MQPDWVRISSDILIGIHAVDGWRALDALHLPIEKDGHIVLLPLAFRRFLGSSEFSFLLLHNNKCIMFVQACDDLMIVKLRQAPK